MRRGTSRRRLLVLLTAVAGFGGAGVLTGGGGEPAGPEALWLAGTGGVLKLADPGGQVLLGLPGLQDARAVAVDPLRAVTWAWAGGALHVYSAAGELLLSTPVPLPRSEDAELVAVPEDGSVWLAVGSELRSFSAAGQPLHAIRLESQAEALAIDLREETLWVGTRRSTTAYDAVTAALIHSFAAEGLRDLDAAPDGGVWVAEKGTLRRYGAEGDLLFEAQGGDLLHVAATPDGGAWVATGKELSRFDGAGEPVFRVQPFDGRAEIVELIADPGDGAAWVAIHDGFARVSGIGEIAHVPALRPSYHVRDLALYADLLPPEVEIARPLAGAYLAARRPLIELRLSDAGTGFDPATLAVEAHGTALAVGCTFREDGASCSPAGDLYEGPTTLSATIDDFAGNRSRPAEVSFTVDTTAPEIRLGAPADGARIAEPEVTIRGALSEPADLSVNGQEVAVAADLTFSATVPLHDGSNAFALTATDRAGNAATRSLRVIRESGPPLPPDPATVAPALDPTIPTDIAAATRFLYSGVNPIQAGMTAVLEPRRVVVLRGRVLDREGNPLPAVKVSLAGQPAFGSTLSRADGMFDFVANGGGVLTVQYEKPGHPAAWRTVATPWRDFVWIEDVALVPYDSEATVVASGAPAVQVARGSLVADEAGTRRATLVFPAGTEAEMVLADGRRQALPTLTIRATEYTVGPRGPAAMPASLPPTTGYTYAVELSVDEAVAAGAKRVSFSQPVVQYLDNFLGFPVGGIVPAGYYDRDLAAWVPSANGRVVRILSIAGGLAELDVSGSGTPADAAALAALGVTEGERRELAALYEPGQSLWRVPIPHFTPWDYNWPYGPPENAEDPPGPDENPDQHDEDDPCTQAGSILECENQILGEAVPVAGTAFRLHYQSERVPGRRSASQIRIPLVGATIPPGLKRVELSVTVAGRRFDQSFAPGANLETTFTWDQRDAYGRTVQGRQPAMVSVGYTYDAVYYSPADFIASFSVVPPSRTIVRDVARSTVTLWRSYPRTIGVFDARAHGLGGWSLSPHHVFDPGSRILFLGDGSRLAPWDYPGQVIESIAGGGSDNREGAPAGSAQIVPFDMAVGPDGTVYVVDHNLWYWYARVRKIQPDGRIRTAVFDSSFAIRGVDVGPDGSVYAAFCDRNGYTPPKVTRTLPNGSSTTLLTKSSLPSLDCPWDVAVDRDGNVYIAEAYPGKILRLGPDRRTTVLAQSLSDVGALAVAGNGSVYFSEPAAHRVRRIAPDGTIATVAGNGQRGFSGDGGAATQARLNGPAELALTPDGGLYIVDKGNHRVRRVTPAGIIETFAGNGTAAFSGDGGFAQAAGVAANGMATGPDGTLYLAQPTSSFSNGWVRRITPPYPGFGTGSVTIASRDGRFVYELDRFGRHVRTFDSLTGTLFHEIFYDAAGHLAGVRDSTGNLTRVERNAAGQLTAIVAPFGQRTELAVDANGFLRSIRNPAGETATFTYSASGLLTSSTDPRGGVAHYGYSDLGLLVTAKDAAGAEKVLTRAVDLKGYEIDLESAEGRHTRYEREALSASSRRRTVTSPAGFETSRLESADGRIEVTDSTGTATRIVLAPDPRFGMQAPIAGSEQVRAPSGLTSTTTRARSATLSSTSPLSVRTLKETVVRNGRTSSGIYDALQRRVTLTSPEGRQRSFLLDELGRPTSLSVAGLEPIAFAYDSRGRLSSVSQGSAEEQRAFHLSYGGDGRLASLTDPLSRTVGFEHDAAGRVLRQVLPDGEPVGVSYDPAGNPASVTPPGRPAHGFQYTPVDLLQEYAPPALGTGEARTRYDYNLDRQLRQVVRPDGQAVDLFYDTAGRPAGFHFSRGQIGYTYHPATHQLVGITAPGGQSLSFTYDGFLPLRATWSGPVAGTVERTYDNDFRVKTLAVTEASPVTFTYDGDGLLRQAGSLILTRNPANGLLASTTSGRVTTVQTYNAFGEPASTETRLDGAPILSTTYTRDRLGRIVQKEETLGGVTDTFLYSYDLAGRLQAVEKNGQPLARYEYDGNGNRISRIAGTVTETADYDAQDRLLRYADITYTYTANGELASKTENGKTINFSYDELGNLREVKLPNGIEIEYVIDGLNRRVGKKVNGALVQGFLYRDQLEPVAELDSSGQVVSLFVYGSRPHVPDYMVKAGRTYRIVSDHLGSPRLVIDTGTGEVVQQMDYDEFGRVILDTNPRFQPFGIAGGLYDSHTRLVRFGARDYGPEVGRWTAKDPIGFGGGDWNLYGYALSDPINFVDPSGLSCKNDSPNWVPVKPEQSNRPVVWLGPGEVYEGPIDGVRPPAWNNDWLKVAPGTDVTISPDGKPELSGLGSMATYFFWTNDPRWYTPSDVQLFEDKFPGRKQPNWPKRHPDWMPPPPPAECGCGQ